MRGIGVSNHQEVGAGVPDIAGNQVLAIGTAAAIPIPTGATHCRVSASTTAGASLAVGVNMSSSAVAWPAASVAASSDSSGHTSIIPGGESRFWQLAGGTTSFGLIAPTSGVASIEFWKRGG